MNSLKQGNAWQFGERRLVWLELKENGEEDGEEVGRWKEQDSGSSCEALEQGRSTDGLRSPQPHGNRTVW